MSKIYVSFQGKTICEGARGNLAKWTQSSDIGKCWKSKKVKLSGGTLPVTAKKFVLHHKCSENVWGLKMLSFIKYLEVIWHDEIQNKKKNGRCKQWLLEKLFFGKRYNVNSMKYFDHIDYYANGRYFLFNTRTNWNYFGLFSVQSLEMRSFNRNLMSQVLNFEYSFSNYPLQNSIIHQFSMLSSCFGQFSYSPILFCSSFSVGMFRHDCLNMPWRLSNYT